MLKNRKEGVVPYTNRKSAGSGTETILLVCKSNSRCQRFYGCSVEPCVQCRAAAAGAAVHRGGEEGVERCTQPRPLRPGSLVRSLSVSASGRAASGPGVRRGAAARWRAAGAVGSGRADGVGAGEDNEREEEEEVGNGAARKRRA